MARGFVAVTMVVVPVLLCGCEQDANVSSSPAAVSMATLDSRRSVVGDRYVFERRDGSKTSSVVTGVTADFVTLEIDNGCIYTAKKNTFAPYAEWKNCGGSSGAQDSTRNGNSIFPMTIGSSESWNFIGTDNQGDGWENTRVCEVVGAVNMTVPAGSFDTYHVRCEDKWWVQEWFMNADGVAVQWARTTKAGSSDKNRSAKMVSFDPA